MYVLMRIEGINLEKLLREAAGEGIVLAGIRRIDAHALSLRVRCDHLAKLYALSRKYGWACREVGAGCGLTLLRFFRRRRMLLPAAALCLILIALSSQMILRVSIVNAGENEAEVRRCLQRAGVKPGRFKASFSLNMLREDLELSLPGLAFSGLRYAGSTLICDCRNAVAGEAWLVPGEEADIVAVQPGIITRISVSSGTPLVKPGDAVHRGQILIRGEERTAQGEVRSVKAEGQVQARVFARGDAKVSMEEAGTVETGRYRRRVTLRTPWHTRVVRDAPPFDSQDVNASLQPVIGLYLPLWRRIETYAETEVFFQKRDKGTAASMAEGAAEEIAKKECPYGALIIDKWVNYSMIDNEFVCATVILEYETAIAGRKQ